ncbi:FAD-dependent oxidoreductase [Rhodoligotrophos defluvii]|uniref:FAD-dependent oxidoreductase n=1 Tax=Rhodoligotrophos defluvii TaxID=2561934 RepID=UPI0010C95183|nr:FAD-dependent oxidoreductase [Rhodoligotrophos defluvii]
MRQPLSSLAGRRFDVAVIGLGVNGASAAQHLAAVGYDVLAVDKGDFASGSSSRSSRLLHCGLRYLAPGASMWEFVRHPGRFAVACRMAKQAMDCRAQFVEATPERVRSLKFCFPFYDDSPYAAWQIDAAFTLLRLLGGQAVPLDYRRLHPEEARRTPLLENLRAPERLRGVAMFREYQFDWPERVVVDTVLDAERLGAVVRNYTPVTALERAGDTWRITLTDGLDNASSPVTVTAAAVLNMAGIWIDQVNGAVHGKQPGRKITGTKGSHIVVRLPPECADYGIATLNRLNEPFYCIPWRGLHYFGPTETLYEGDLDDIHPTEEEFAFLLGEANHLLPSLNLSRNDVLFGWSGVRPLTYNPEQPLGVRSRELHDLGAEGLPNMFAMTAGPVMTHRSAGAEVVKTLRAIITPKRPAQTPSYASPPASALDLDRAIAREYPESLVDLLFRRLGAGWSETMGTEQAEAAARALGAERGWSEARIRQELADYLTQIQHRYLAAPAVVGPERQKRETA